MQPLDAFPIAARRKVRGVLVDIDDTLTTDGRLTAEAYGALERLHDAGLLVVPITGVPPAGVIISPACGRSMRWSARTVPFISVMTGIAGRSSGVTPPTAQPVRPTASVSMR